MVYLYFNNINKRSYRFYVHTLATSERLTAVVYCIRVPFTLTSVMECCCICDWIFTAIHSLRIKIKQSSYEMVLRNLISLSAYDINFQRIEFSLWKTRKRTFRTKWNRLRQCCSCSSYGNLIVATSHYKGIFLSRR